MAASSSFVSVPQRHSRRLTRLGFALLRFRFFLLESVAAGSHRGRNRILLTLHHVLATLDQIVGAVSQLARLALRVFAAFVGLVHQIFARIFARFRRKKHADQRANPESYQEKCDFGTDLIVAHDSASVDVVFTLAHARRGFKETAFARAASREP